MNGSGASVAGLSDILLATIGFSSGLEGYFDDYGLFFTRGFSL